MKKRYLYFFSILFFFTATGFIILRYQNKERNKEAAFYLLKERNGILINNAEWVSVKNTAADLMKTVRINPEDVKANIALATLYIQEGRITGDYMYYDAAAMKYVNDVLKIDSKNFTALSLKSLIQLSQHHFSEGLETAKEAQKINPHNAFIYGIMVDGYVEMGNYEEAVINSDKMVSIRPDIRSYSRISYLREIHGDYPGAIEAMKMAVDAGPAGDETTAWARVQLGQLFEYSGDLPAAEMHYTIALENRSGYAYALAGLARIATSKKDYAKAITFYEKASKAVVDYAFKDELVYLYRITGDRIKADAVASEIINTMRMNAEAGNNDETLGHYSDRELAYAYLKINNTKKAMEHALAEYNRRPDNIDVNEALAWVHYKRGAYDKALPYIKTALRTGSKNPVLLSRAGLILKKTSDKASAKKHLEEALKNQPHFDPELKMEVEKSLGS